MKNQIFFLICFISIIFIPSYKIQAQCYYPYQYSVSWCEIGQRSGCGSNEFCGNCGAGYRCFAACDSGYTASCSGPDIVCCPIGHPCGSCIPSSCSGGTVFINTNQKFVQKENRESFFNWKKQNNKSLVLENFSIFLSKYFSILNIKFFKSNLVF